MHRIIVMGIFTLAASLFSTSLIAGKIEVCEEIKHDPEYKGLYGLCNAYWNADEEDREDILRNFERKAGPDGPGMPGVEDNGFFDCPCWDDVSYQNVCDLGEPGSNLEGNWIYSDFFIDPGVPEVSQRIFSFNSFNSLDSTPNVCLYFIQDSIGQNSQTVNYYKRIENLESETQQLCRSEVTVMATLYEDALCD